MSFNAYSIKKRGRASFRGFTLIELLVVIAIIGVLASVVMVSLNGARTKANDTNRKASLRQLQIALEYYYTERSSYPGETNCDSSVGSCSTACPCSGSSWDSGAGIHDLITGGYTPELPLDPINNSTYYIQYEPTDDGARGYFIRAALESGGYFTLCGGTYTSASCD